MDLDAGDHQLAQVIGDFPYRMALAGGWIDQPFVSRYNPDPTGSMVVVGLRANCWYMERAGMATGTRKIALDLWGSLPTGDPAAVVRELYAEENRDQHEPSGSQDMIGLVYPGVNRLDFSIDYEEGIFPVHIESNNDPEIAHWLERVVHVLPVAQRPAGYNPLGVKNLDSDWIQRLGHTGTQCYEAILARDLDALGASMTECMACWEAILPHTVAHPTIHVDLPGILRYYQERYVGAMYSGCGGGYLYVVSDEPVPGGFQPSVRTAAQ